MQDKDCNDLQSSEQDILYWGRYQMVHCSQGWARPCQFTLPFVRDSSCPSRLLRC